MANNVCNPQGKYLFTSILLITILGVCFMWYRSSDYTAFVLTVSETASTFKLEIHNKLPTYKNNTNWIVVTTIKQPSQDIDKLTHIKGWQVLVVGDLKTPKNWSHPGCIFLGNDQQKELGFQITSRLPSNSYTRKIIGYLYAIQHGAKRIYDTDDDNHPSGGKINFHQREFTSGLIYDNATNDVMNPYAHFGQPSIWPRGYPLDHVDLPNGNAYKLCTFRTPAIQQGLVNGDVDAIFRLTRKLPNERYINVTFDARAPPVTLPEGIFAPFNSQNTHFAYDAFWALFLPTSVAFRVTDIWRGYWAQRLLWLLGQRLAFFPPNAVQFRNSHDYLDDFQDENQFYRQTNSLIKFLKSWTCPRRTFFECVSHLGHEMANASFWENSDAELIDLWIADLVAVGYEEPVMKNVTDECSKKGVAKRVFFEPVMQGDQIEDVGLSDINRFCDERFNISSMEMTDTGEWVQPKNLFDDVLLVIVFNFPFYKNIRLLDALYYDHFSNIAYCGQTASYQKLRSETDQGPFPWRQRPLTFINITMNKGYFGYECAIRAMEMQYNVNGYLIIADDLMFNSWNFERVRHLDVAQMQKASHRTVNRTSGPTKWMWWGSSLGKKVVEKSLDQLEVMADKNADKTQKKLVSKYIANRYEAKFNMSLVNLGVSDLYYIPVVFKDMFLEVMNVFLNNRVFLEIAVPTTIAGMNPNISSIGFEGKSLWGGNRKAPLQYFNATKHYVHPMKFSQLFSKSDVKNEYCQTYVSHLIL